MTHTKTEKRSEQITRDHILKMLSDEETARVSAAETKGALTEGEEYLDLGHLDQGVRTMIGGTIPMHNVLARNAVQESTWARIITQLATPRIDAQ